MMQLRQTLLPFETRQNQGLRHLLGLFCFLYFLGEGNSTHLVVDHNALNNGFVKHLFVPILQTLWLGDFLLWWMTVEYVIISFAGWTGPNVCHCVAEKTGMEGGNITAVPWWLLPQIHTCLNTHTTLDAHSPQ